MDCFWFFLVRLRLGSSLGLGGRWYSCLGFFSL